jgi:hypothetical protein
VCPLRALAICVLHGLSLGASSAAAEPQRAELVVDADDTCVSAEVLRARAATNAWRWLERPEQQAELSLAASVRAQTDGSLQVALQIRWRDGHIAQRTLAAQSCDAALDALALLVRMTLDAAERSAQPAPAQPVSADAADADPERAVWSEPTQLVLGAQLGLGTGAAPGRQPSLGAYAALELRGVGVLRPRLQVELSHAWHSGVSVMGARADFALDGGQMLACPVGMGGSVFAAHGCAAFELARLQARGHDTYDPRSRVRAWASAGVGLLVHARPVSLLELQLGASLLHPLWRDQFSFAPDVFYSVPDWRWQLKLGLAVRFL